MSCPQSAGHTQGRWGRMLAGGSLCSRCQVGHSTVLVPGCNQMLNCIALILNIIRKL